MSMPEDRIEAVLRNYTARLIDVQNNRELSDQLYDTAAVALREVVRDGQRDVLLGIRNGINEVPGAANLPGIMATLRIIEKLLAALSPDTEGQQHG